MSASDIALPKVDRLTRQRNRRFSVLFWENEPHTSTTIAEEFPMFEQWRSLQPHRMHRCNNTHCELLYAHQPRRTLCVHVQIVAPHVMIGVNDDVRTLHGFDICLVELFARMLKRRLQYVVYKPYSSIRNMTRPGFHRLGDAKENM